ncbi:MAG: peptidyl-prolyl cis-trans isomerase [Candidatus Aminicenantes bacterium]|nr:peptidyl-prolyl cis-trans isomerase [Candidatus Aminicenantes bacterium]
MRVVFSLLDRPAALLAAFAIFLAVGCGNESDLRKASSSDGAGDPGRIVLDVEGSAFTVSDFDRYVRTNAGTGKLSDLALSRLFDKFVEEKLLLEAGRRQGVSLTQEEKKDYLIKLAGESQPEEAAAPARGEQDESLFDRPLIDKYAYPLLKDIRVQDEEVQSFYEEHKKDFLLPERVRVSQVLLETEEKAVEVLRNLENATEEEFRKIAEEESAGPEAFKGGEMGVFKSGDLPYEMEKVIFALEEGKLSRVVESSYGFHVFRLDKRFPPELLSEEQAAPSIRVRILDGKVKEALASHLEELKGSLAWSSHPEMLNFAYQRNET